MRGRHGFTLVEVMIALLIGSVVTGLAYATFAAGLDTQARVAQAQETDAAATTFRTVLMNALRHAVPGDADDPQGLHTDDAGTTLDFVSRGIEAPIGGRGAWRVSLLSQPSGLLLRADAREGRATPLHLTARGVTRVALRFLPLASTAWQDHWSDASRLPDAVEVRFLDAQGRDALPPLLTRTSPVSGT